MVLDVRAKILCNLGPVISGSVKDDHVQGQGLVLTTGDLVLAGLITPAHGDEVKLAYITPDDSTVALFPRGPFYVTKAFADPLRNQTQISIANKLAFQKGKGGGVVSSALVDGLNGRIPKTAKAMDLRESFEVIASRLGVEIEQAGGWSINKQLAALNSADYVETLSDMLASATHFGYLNAQGRLVAQSYADLSTAGPVFGFDRVIDLAGNQGGLDFTENPAGSGNAQTVDDEVADQPSTIWLPGGLVQEARYGEFQGSWDQSATSTETDIKVTLRNGSTVSYAITETVETAELKAEPDNRTLERTSVTSTALVKVNSQVIQDFLNAGGGGPSPATPITSRKTDRYTYEEIPPEPLTEQEQEQVQQEITAAQQAIAQNNPGSTHPVLNPSGTIVLLPKLPTYRVVLEETSETMSYVEALGRIGVKDYSKMESIPSGEGIKESVITEILYSETKQKRIERIYVAYGLTQMGQQAISAAALRAPANSSLAPYIDQFFSLVLEDVKVVTSDLNLSEEEKPVPDYLAPYKSASAVIQGSSRIQVGAQPEQRANKAVSFAVPYLPDDVVNDDGSVSKGNAEASAASYAEEQNRLLLGHRLGLQVTTALGVLPTQPLGAFHLRNDGITATYRTNGTAWSFDANSCLVSTDALYWGLAGGDINGPLWTPLAPGTTALPTPPADVDHGPQSPVNSLPLEEPVDVSDIAAVSLLIDSLPDDEAEVFETELEPLALALPFKSISPAVFEVRLQAETLLVPLGINRSMGDAALQARLQLEAQHLFAEHVVLQLECSERRVLVETLSAGLGLGGNLS